MTDEIKIDRNMPIPAQARRSSLKYPFADLDIGESFFVPGRTGAQLSGFISWNRPKKFATRTVIENGVKGVRVWRTA